MIELLKNQTVDGSGNPESAQGASRTLFCFGNFGGGTVTLELSLDDITWVTNADLTFTSDSVVNFEVAPGTRLRGTLAGSTGADVNLILK